MFDHDSFRALYGLLSGDQTVDDDGPVDCGVRCDKFCCRPGHTTKYLLPGERDFLSVAMRERGEVFHGVSLGFFDSIDEPLDRACACETLRELRPFNCRIFPYSPVFDERRVVGLKKGKLAQFEPCWITTPNPSWEKDAIVAWQNVLDDADNRALFARLTTMWEWHKAVERGEEPGHVLVALATLDNADDDELWSRALRFFSRSD